MGNDLSQLFEGFGKLSREERFARLEAFGALTTDDLKYLKKSRGLDLDLAEHWIENAIGYFPMPLGLAQYFRIDGVDRIIPMAVEETSIIAAASKTAKWIRESGDIRTELLGRTSIGQIQISKIQDPERFVRILEKNQNFLIDQVHTYAIPDMVRRGGGLRSFHIRFIDRPDGLGQMLVLHVHIDTCDSMGANAINQVCEFLKDPLEQLSGERIDLCILSNLCDTKRVRAEATIRNVEKSLGERIQEASYFAEQDPYRAATSNKGVLNGIDPILIATGNDWRGVEAGIHAYASRDGRYRSITQWRYQPSEHAFDESSGLLYGCFEAPLVVGTVGGVTRQHPTAALCLRLLNCDSAESLARVVAAVGLVQNLGAIRALCTEGIIQGHMRLHINNLLLESGANERERPILRRRLEELLRLKKRVSVTRALDILQELRARPQTFADSSL